MSHPNDPRLRQDDYEKKDKENSNAGMIASIIIALIAVIGIFLFYHYEVAGPDTTPIATPAPTPVAPANNAATTTTTTDTTAPTTTTPAATDTTTTPATTPAPATTPSSQY